MTSEWRRCEEDGQLTSDDHDLAHTLLNSCNVARAEESAREFANAVSRWSEDEVAKVAQEEMPEDADEGVRGCVHSGTRCDLLADPDREPESIRETFENLYTKVAKFTEAFEKLRTRQHVNMTPSGSSTDRVDAQAGGDGEDTHMNNRRSVTFVAGDQVNGPGGAEDNGIWFLCRVCGIRLRQAQVKNHLLGTAHRKRVREY